MNFRQWFTLDEEFNEGYSVENRNLGTYTNLIPVPATKSTLTTIEYSEDEKHYMNIELRLLGGEAVAGTGFGGQTPRYLVATHHQPPKSQIDQQLVAMLKKKYGSMEVKYRFENDFAKGLAQAAGVKELPQSVQVKTPGVIFILQSDGAEFLLRRMAQDVQVMLKPLVDNGLIDSLDIRGIDNQHFQSPNYQQQSDKYENDRTAVIGQLKHAVQMVTQGKYPATQKSLMDRLNDYYPDVQPNQTKADLRNNPLATGIYDFLEGLNRYMIQNIIAFDEQKLQLAENLLKAAKKHGLSEDQLQYSTVDILDYDAFQKLKSDLEAGENLILLPKTAFAKPFVKSFETIGLGDRIEWLREHLKNEIVKAFTGGDAEGLPWDLIEQSYKELGLPDEIVQQLGDYFGQKKKRAADVATQRTQSRQRATFIIGDSAIKYMVAGADRWEDIPDEYQNYSGDIEVGRMVRELDTGVEVDDESLYYAAYEKVREDAEGNLEGRPSEEYGKDKKEVEEDIGYEYDDFISDEALEDDALDEIVARIGALWDKKSEAQRNLYPQKQQQFDFAPNAEDHKKRIEEYEAAIAEEEDKIVAIVKKDYHDEFLKWKIAKIKEEEQGESWKYEVDEEDNDFRVKISEIQDELAEEEAWKKGLVTLTRDDFDKPTEIWMHSEYLDKMKPIIKKTVEVNMQEKDQEFNEPLWKPSHQIKIWLVDKNKTDARSAYQWAYGK